MSVKRTLPDGLIQATLIGVPIVDYVRQYSQLFYSDAESLDALVLLERFASHCLAINESATLSGLNSFKFYACSLLKFLDLIETYSVNLNQFSDCVINQKFPNYNFRIDKFLYANASDYEDLPFALKSCLKQLISIGLIHCPFCNIFLAHDHHYTVNGLESTFNFSNYQGSTFDSILVFDTVSFHLRSECRIEITDWSDPLGFETAVLPNQDGSEVYIYSPQINFSRQYFDCTYVCESRFRSVHIVENSSIYVLDNYFIRYSYIFNSEGEINEINGHQNIPSCRNDGSLNLMVARLGIVVFEMLASDIILLIMLMRCRYTHFRVK